VTVDMLGKPLSTETQIHGLALSVAIQLVSYVIERTEMKLGLYKWFCKLRDAWNRLDKSDEARLFLFVLNIAMIGLNLMGLEQIKNFLLWSDTEWFVHAPLWNLTYTQMQLWDIHLVLIIVNLCSAVVCAWSLGKRTGNKEVID